MSANVNYPHCRVIVGFTLCPAVVALFGVGVELFYGILHQQYMDEGWGGYFVKLLAVSLALVMAAVITYGVPACILALIYVAMKLRKSLWAYMAVFIFGGLSAQVWGWLLIIMVGLGSKPFEFPWAFIMGAFSSLIMAFLVLPKPIRVDE